MFTGKVESRKQEIVNPQDRDRLSQDSRAGRIATLFGEFGERSTKTQESTERKPSKGNQGDPQKHLGSSNEESPQRKPNYKATIFGDRLSMAEHTNTTRYCLNGLASRRKREMIKIQRFVSTHQTPRRLTGV